MKLGKEYKHINNDDVYFKPTSIVKTNGLVEVYGFWMNCHYNFIISDDWITIKDKDIENWQEYKAIE